MRLNHRVLDGKTITIIRVFVFKRMSLFAKPCGPFDADPLTWRWSPGYPLDVDSAESELCVIL